MANPTTNFGWVMPTATSLVTNLPADFNTFGQAVDTSLQYLLGGTTGQVLSKTSGTNMAFSWVTPQVGDITAVNAGTGISGGGTTGDVTITNSMATAITTSGDLIQGTGSGTFARLGTGTSGQYLTTNGTTNSWVTAPAGYAPTLISTTTMSGTTTTISGISGASYSALYLYTTVVNNSTNNSATNITINGVTSGYVGNSMATAWSTNIPIANLYSSGSPTAHFMQILNVKATSGNKYINGTCSIPAGTTTIFNGILPQNAVVSSISINGTGTLSGTMYLLGA